MKDIEEAKEVLVLLDELPPVRNGISIDLVPDEDIEEARRHPGEWVELPLRWLTKEPSSWCSEVRAGKKRYLGRTTERWDAQYKPTGRRNQGKSEYAIAILYLGPSFDNGASVPSFPLNEPVVLLSEEEEEEEEEEEDYY